MGTSTPECELFLPSLDIDIPVQAPPLSRIFLNLIQSQLMSPISASSDKGSLPSVGPGAYDNTAFPPSHQTRTIILCFDATGYQSVMDVRLYMLSMSAHALLADNMPFRIPTSYSSTLC